MNQATNQPNHPHDPNADQNRSALMEEQVRLKQKEEEKEVAGKHKNDGQKDHKGAR